MIKEVDTEEIKLIYKGIKSSLSKDLLKENISEIDFKNFKNNLVKLLNELETASDNKQGEENRKNLFRDFLKQSFYEGKYFLNTMSYKGNNEADLVIHSENNQNSDVSVIFEVKTLKNKSEMISKKITETKSVEFLKTKSFLESVLYFFWEVVYKGNLELKNIVITNIFEFYIFSASEFKRVFLNSSLKTDFEKWQKGLKIDPNTDTFYKLVENFINNNKKRFNRFRFTYFDIREIKNDEYFKYLYKIISPKFLLKENTGNDSNTLDKDFYNELLHIIGLEEVEKEGKKLIQRKKNPDRGSLLENTISVLKENDSRKSVSNLSSFGNNENEQYYNIALSLCIRWINRILFLKLLEGQLFNYHNGDKNYKFLEFSKIKTFKKLNKIFFSVLAQKTDDREKHIQEEFFRIPYLNSSLFEKSELEEQALTILHLEDDLTLPVYKNTVLKDGKKKLKGNLNSFEYLLNFLNSFDFGSEEKNDNKTIEDHKKLINASVLGLIFEKINGYKDGSFYTPGFITTYMCRESIEKCIIQKFNDKYNWDCQNIEDLKDKIENRKEANELINTIKICDPAVGSGHFLVSALNEIISIKSELGVLFDTNGKRIRDYRIENNNDELQIIDEDNEEHFEYKVSSHTDFFPVQRVINKSKNNLQKALFFEKKQLIENCLFGVDINNNSVMICRLRLWIELLKSAYYTEESNYTELETLPNIDINIKCGNSLISRYSLDSDLKDALKKSKWNVSTYQNAISVYQNAKNKDQKKEIEKLINEIKSNFKTEIQSNDKRFRKLRDLEVELFNHTNQGLLFERSKKELKEWNDKVTKLTDQIKKQKEIIEEIKNSIIYKDAFEWRFEFPEVLDQKGNFVGFDVVIGNPPYGVKLSKEDIDFYNKIYNLKSSETAILFIERGYSLLKKHGIYSYIIPKSYTFASNYSKARDFTKEELSFIVDCGKAFDMVKLEVCIFGIIKSKSSNFYNSYSCLENQEFKFLGEIDKKIINTFGFFPNGLNKYDINLGHKINKAGLFLKDIASNSRGDIIQKYISEKGDLKVIGGKEIDRYSIKNSKGFINKSFINSNKARINDNSLLVQRIVAHITKPYEHIKITACIPESNEYIITDTINQITIKSNRYSKKFIWSILNSKLINWYVYLFIFAKAIRTMQFDNPVTDRIPIQEISLEKQKAFIEIVDQILENKKNNIDTTDLEKQIDLMVYELYGLTDEEIRVVEDSL